MPSQPVGMDGLLPVASSDVQTKRGGARAAMGTTLGSQSAKIDDRKYLTNSCQACIMVQSKVRRKTCSLARCLWR